MTEQTVGSQAGCAEHGGDDDQHGDGGKADALSHQHA